MATEAYHVGKVALIAGGFLLQSHTSTFDDMKTWVSENDSNDDTYDARLAETLPFCHDIHIATQSPGSMLAYLNEFSIDDIRARVASAEPIITITLINGTTERKVNVNNLCTLNIFLTKYGDISSLPNVRIKHNGTRMFLSGTGKKSLARLGFANNDVIEVEDITSGTNCIDITNLSLNSPNSQAATASSGGGKRSKRKGKNKKGKKK